MYLSSQPNHERPPADGFWRVQDDQSFTHYDENEGFVANGRYYSYWMSDWFNAKTVNNHLDWAARPKEKTPFISVFDNFGTYLYPSFYNPQKPPIISRVLMQ